MRAKIVTLPLWTDGEAGHDAFSEELTSSDEDDEDTKSVTETPTKNEYVHDCGSMGK